MKTKLKPTPSLFFGDIAVDDRGEVGYINDFDMSKIKRFYTIKNHVPGFVRAWHGHFKEEKYFMMLSGAAIIAAIEIKKDKNGVIDIKRQGFKRAYPLSSKVSSILHIPKGYANGFKLLNTDSQLIVFSTLTTKESIEDDHRFSATHYYDLWDVKER